MTAAVKKIELEFQQLPLADLLVLHEHLIQSIRSKEEAVDLEPAFRDDIRRRVDEIVSGKAKGLEAFEALREM